MVLLTLVLQTGHTLPFALNMVSEHFLQKQWPHGIQVRDTTLSQHIRHVLLSDISELKRKGRRERGEEKRGKEEDGR